MTEKEFTKDKNQVSETELFYRFVELEKQNAILKDENTTTKKELERVKADLNSLERILSAFRIEADKAKLDFQQERDRFYYRTRSLNASYQNLMIENRELTNNIIELRSSANVRNYEILLEKYDRLEKDFLRTQSIKDFLSKELFAAEKKIEQMEKTA